MGSGELGELPQDARADSPEERKAAAGRHERARPRRAAAETQTRDEYGESMRSQGDPIPSSTADKSPASHESSSSPAADDKRPVERPPPDEPGDRERAEPQGSDSQAADSQPADSQPGDSEGRRVDLASEPAQEQSPLAESVPHEPGADSDLSPADSDQAKALADDPGTDDHPLWHFHADFKGAHYDWYLPGPDTQPTNAETRDAPPAERAGDLIADLDDVRRSRADAFGWDVCEDAEHLPDAMQDLASPVKDFFARPPSSAHAVLDTRPVVTQLAHDETDTGTMLTGLTLLSILAIRAVRGTVQYLRHRKDEIGDQRRADDRPADPADREPG